MLIDTHAHLDGEEFRDDLDDVMARAAAAGVEKVLLPAIDLASAESVVAVCRRFPGRAYPMIGLHPEEVKADWQAVLAKMHELLLARRAADEHPWIAIGEVGLDYYWSREFADEQLLAFEEQVKWSVETRLPLMIHCRKAQNEMVTLLKRYRSELPGGVFHCFTGNALEAEQLLQFDNFMLGIGGSCSRPMPRTWLRCPIAASATRAPSWWKWLTSLPKATALHPTRWHASLPTTPRECSVCPEAPFGPPKGSPPRSPQGGRKSPPRSPQGGEEAPLNPPKVGESIFRTYRSYRTYKPYMPYSRSFRRPQGGEEVFVHYSLFIIH